jgi:hypothetical protein
VKRLGNRASKMAFVVMADVDEDNANREAFSRPLHKAFLANKVVCPMPQCVQRTVSWVFLKIRN